MIALNIQSNIVIIMPISFRIVIPDFLVSVVDIIISELFVVAADLWKFNSSAAKPTMHLLLHINLGSNHFRYQLLHLNNSGTFRPLKVTFSSDHFRLLFIIFMVLKEYRSFTRCPWIIHNSTILSDLRRKDIAFSWYAIGKV